MRINGIITTYLLRRCGDEKDFIFVFGGIDGVYIFVCYGLELICGG